MRIEKLSIQVLCHATEVEDKVMRAVENVVGSEVLEKMSLISNSLKGYYGDPITLIKLNSVDSRVAREGLIRIFSGLSEEERDEVLREGLEWGKHGGKLYIRLDKQAAYLGSLRLSDRDSIRIQVIITGEKGKFLREVKEKIGKRIY